MRNLADVRERCVVRDGFCELIRNIIVSPHTLMHEKEALARETVYIDTFYLWDQQSSHKRRINERSSIASIRVLRIDVSLL